MRKLFTGDIFYNVDDTPLPKPNAKRIKGKKYYYVPEFMTFDIEASTIDGDRPYGFMYIWQAAVGVKNAVATYGRTWYDWFEYLDMIRKHYSLSPDVKMVVYAHYLPYEYQFIKRLIEFTEVFATDKRQPLRCVSKYFEFRCSYKLSNMSLDKFCKYTGAKHAKVVGHFDYTIRRTPATMLWDMEYYYSFCDVVGLHESIEKLLEEDTLETIPMTNTGYIRRECRNAMRANPDNWKWYNRVAPNAELYVLIKEAMRGGDTHCNRHYVGRILDNVDSYDFASSYPYVMCCCYFPIGKFTKIAKVKSLDHLRTYLQKYCCIFRLYLNNLRLKPGITNPYIPLSKCLKKKNPTVFNGRILECEVVQMTVTELDFDIIANEYTWDAIAISDLHIAKRGLLPHEMRKMIIKLFQVKSELKGVDDYLYAKSKNRINSCFGMACTDPVHDTYYDDMAEWRTETADIHDALEANKRSRNQFLPYQVGLYVTSHARHNLRDIIRIAGEGNVYNDTDCSKVWGVDITDEIERYNEKVRQIAEENGAYAVLKDGRKIYMGVAEKEKGYDKFVSLGAKKYCVVQDGKLKLTLSGVDKKKGAKQLNSIEDFKIGKVFVPDCGRTTSWYNETAPEILHMDGIDFLSASNIGVLNSTYQLGVTEEFNEYLNIDIDI